MVQVIPHRAEMQTEEILRLYASGYRISCRYCKVEFRTIPEKLKPGEQPSFVQCPNNPNHMSVCSDTMTSLRAVREAMRDGAPE